MNNIIINGTQDFMGVKIPVIEGGFGKGKRCLTDKTISEIHGMKMIHVREALNKNIKRFKENIDFIDLKDIDNIDNNLLVSLNYSKMQISKAKNIYLLSERGYAKLIKIMDTDLAWEIHDKLVDDYFTMREIVNSKEKILAETFYKSIFSNTEEDRVLNTKLFGELKEEYGAEKQKEIDKIELENERIENYLSTIDLIKQLPSKKLFTKIFFEALEIKGYGENKLINKKTRFIHNDKFENEFIKNGLCRASITNVYTWNPKMVDYIIDNDILKLMQQISKIINRTTEEKKRRKTNEGYTYRQALKILNNNLNNDISLEYLMNKLKKINWLDKNEIETQYARDNNYMYRYYKYSKITDDGLNKLLELLQ